MHYIGIDYHKQYSYCTVIDDTGKQLLQTRIPNQRHAVEALLTSYQPAMATLEASRNWEVMYDWVEAMTRQTILAHPLKVKAIASAKVKTDKIDSNILAQLLKADLLPAAHVPKSDTRDTRAILRQRMFFVRMRSAVKNRITTLIDKYEDKPPVKNIFSGKGMLWLKELLVSQAHRQILDNDLNLLQALNSRIEESNILVDQIYAHNHDARLLSTIPGIGVFFSVLISSEIDGIDRFESERKLHSYAGLVPSTHQSGKSMYHGKITKQGNKWIRYALVEAVYPAIRKDTSVKDFYTRIKNKKGANPAKIATARRLLTICYKVLKEKRQFQVRLP